MTVLERFLKYVSYPTMSKEGTGTHPSTEKQLKLAAALVEELSDLGLSARLDKYGYVYATLEANAEGANAIGLIAHMDTSSEASDENIKPRVVDYSGGDIVLNTEKNIVMRVSDFPSLSAYNGQRLVVTDGTTLLGADDKAGVAEIMSAVEKILSAGLPHGKICIAFTPDEEIGEGADNFDVKAFGADYAYTVDGGSLGELEYENFNAASARVKVNGVVIHPGAAKDRMKNAVRILSEFNSLLPENEIPERTTGYEGFHHLLAMSGECELATAAYIIRDHDTSLFEKKKEQFVKAAQLINERYGEGTLELVLKDSYYNMGEIIRKNIFTVERAAAAMRSLGVNPITVPIRGGTDGARLSFMGLPCPNLSTGGENFHSRFEFVSVDSMEKMTEVLVRILTDAAELPRIAPTLE